MRYSTAHASERVDATACGCDEHKAQLDAIHLRDAPEAARRMREHLQRLEAQLRFPVAGEFSADLALVLAGH